MTKSVGIIGGGHNGLVCACYLAKAGFDVTVYERRDIVGGAAVTEEFYPGFKNSTCSYTVGLLPSKIIDDLNLHTHGLKILPRLMNNFVPTTWLPRMGHYKEGELEYLRFGRVGLNDIEEIRRLSEHDAENYPAYVAMLNRVVAVFKEFVWDTPPTTKGLKNIFPALKAAGRLNSLSEEGQREVIDLFTKSAADVVEQYFEHDLVKALMCWDSIVGNYTSPYTPGTAYVLLHHVWGESTHGWGHAIGGMGAITQAMQAEAEALGVTVKTNTTITEVWPSNEKFGIMINDYAISSHDIIVSNVHPQILYQDLIGHIYLPDEFKKRIKAYKSGSGTFRMNVALDELPTFTCLPEPGDHLGAGILMMPSLEYMEKAYFDSRCHGWSLRPVVEMLIPSIIDNTLAPKGKHVASLFCQHFDPDIEWTDEKRKTAAQDILRVVEWFAPGFRDSVIGYSALSPRDLQEQFGLVRGDIFHGQLTLDQMYSNRPVLGYGNYRGPLEGLYMCGSGTHPGGGVTGIPGHNAAREIIKDN